MFDYLLKIKSQGLKYPVWLMSRKYTDSEIQDFLGPNEIHLTKNDLVKSASLKSDGFLKMHKPYFPKHKYTYFTKTSFPR